MSNIDYKQLLTKYLARVAECEGTDFILIPYPEVEFTDAEQAELCRLSIAASQLHQKGDE